jgi:hypothetical protein
VNTEQSLKDALLASAHRDIYQAVAAGNLTIPQAERAIRRRERDKKRGRTITGRHFKSLFSDTHGNRHTRRANAVFNRRLEKVNTEKSLIKVEILQWQMRTGEVKSVADFDARLASFEARLPKPLPVLNAGIVFKASWPADRKVRTAMKKAQRAIRTSGGTPRPQAVAS